jgi:hypothetical protein
LAPVDHRLHRLHDIVAVRGRRLEPEYVPKLVEQRRRSLLVNAHRAVALHIRMTAHRANTGARPADISPQQLMIAPVATVEVPAKSNCGDSQHAA